MPTQQLKTVEEVTNAIKSLPSMSALNPEEYAEKDGWAEVVVKGTKGSLKATQLRKIFHYIKDLRRDFQRGGLFNRAKVALISPQLAYASGRGHIPREFFELMTLCFGQSKCKSVEDFESAVNFLEAIMAYHKYHHPKD